MSAPLKNIPDLGRIISNVWKIILGRLVAVLPQSSAQFNGSGLKPLIHTNEH
jgi:hypothetical protein